MSFPPPPQERPSDWPSFGDPYVTPASTGLGWAEPRGRRLAERWGDAPGAIRVATASQLLVAALVAVDGLLGIVQGGQLLIAGSTRTPAPAPQDLESAVLGQTFGAIFLVMAVAELLFVAVGFVAVYGLLKRRRGWWAVAVAWQFLTALVVGGTSRDPISVSVAAVGIAGLVALLLPASRDHVRPHAYS